MENRKDLTIRIAIAIIVSMILIIISLRKPDSLVTPPINECKEDSLKVVINQFELDMKNDEDGWDNKEERYENIIFEYEYGLDRLKQTHPDAYREFHRIVGYKERFSREIERDNIKRLKINKW